MSFGGLGSIGFGGGKVMSAAFAPSDIADLAGWWEADDPSDFVLESTTTPSFESPWNAIGILSQTANQADPMGGTDAAAVVEDTTVGSAHYLSGIMGTVATSGSDMTFTFWAKSIGSRNWILVEFGGMSIYVRISDGETSAYTGVAEVVHESAGNGWRKFVITKRAATAGLSSVQLYLSSDVPSYIYTGDGTSGVYLYGASMTYGRVSEWRDRRGGAHTKLDTSASPTTRPNRRTGIAGFSGKAFVRFDGSSEFLQATSFGLAGSHTVFTVYRGTDSNAYIWSHDNNAASAWYYVWTDTGYSIGQRVSGTDDNRDIASGWGSSSTARVLVRRYNGATGEHKVRIDRVDQTLTGSGSALGTATMTGRHTLCADWSGAGNFAGEIAAHIVYNRALSDAEVARVENYLASKYGTP